MVVKSKVVIPLSSGLAIGTLGKPNAFLDSKACVIFFKEHYCKSQIPTFTAVKKGATGINIFASFAVHALLEFATEFD